MTSLNKYVVVEFHTQQDYCSCCNQKLPETKTSEVKEFVIRSDDAECWTDWNSAAEYPEDIESLIPEFVYETIRFWAVESDVKIVIEPGEIEKVKEFILREVVEDTQEGKGHVGAD